MSNLLDHLGEHGKVGRAQTRHGIESRHTAETVLTADWCGRVGGTTVVLEKEEEEKKEGSAKEQHDVRGRNKEGRV
jgi:hypothetical protein